MGSASGSWRRRSQLSHAALMVSIVDRSTRVLSMILDRNLGTRTSDDKALTHSFGR